MTMSFFRRLFARFALGTAIFAGTISAASAEVIYFLYQGVLVATMTTTNATDFNLEFEWAPASGTAAKINDLYLTGPKTGTFTNLSGDTAPDATGRNDRPQADWIISWPVSGNTFNEGENSMFRIAVSSPSDWDFGRLHINAFLADDSIKLTGCVAGDPNCVPEICEPNSTAPECNPTIPEPGTLALLGAGLAGLALIRRRRRD